MCLELSSINSSKLIQFNSIDEVIDFFTTSTDELNSLSSIKIKIGSNRSISIDSFLDVIKLYCDYIRYNAFCFLFMFPFKQVMHLSMKFVIVYAITLLICMLLSGLHMNSSFKGYLGNGFVLTYMVRLPKLFKLSKLK